jgi:hypothetical protein
MDVQEYVDAYYMKHGPCCAGCDHWEHISSTVGLCRKAAPVSQQDRYGPLRIESCSLWIGSGHPLTPRDYHCGEFTDTFDWSTLPPNYRRKIGHKTEKTRPR